jgi:Raf kinase inhibitor-like YbhB/YbcL family protein
VDRRAAAAWGPILLALFALSIEGAEGQEASFAVHSPAFPAGGEIPARYTCEGADRSPPLAWSEPPPGTRSFALVVDDPDAPDPAAPKTTWVHWVVVGIPSKVRELSDGAGSGVLPTGARNGLNDWKRPDYGGPCPPIGRHRYFHKLYALDTNLSELSSPTKAELEQAMQGHVLARAELVGTYEKKNP